MPRHDGLRTVHKRVRFPLDHGLRPGLGHQLLRYRRAVPDEKPSYNPRHPLQRAPCSLIRQGCRGGMLMSDLIAVAGAFRLQVEQEIIRQVREGLRACAEEADAEFPEFGLPRVGRSWGAWEAPGACYGSLQFLLYLGPISVSKFRHEEMRPTSRCFLKGPSPDPGLRLSSRIDA